MKKTLKKLIVALLTSITFTNTISTFAMESTSIQSESTFVESLSDLTSCIREFESLAPGIFYVDPELIQSTKPEILYKALSQMTKILKAYPNITRKLAQAAQRLTTSHRFAIKVLDEHEKANQLFTMAGMGAFTARCKVEKSEFAICINTNHSSIQSGESKNRDIFVKTDTDFITQIITHEMGHLFFVINMYHTDPVKFSNFLTAWESSLALTEKYLKEVVPYVSGLDPNDVLKAPAYIAYTKSPEYAKSIDTVSHVAQYTAESFETIKMRIIDLARKNGYGGDDDLSHYAKSSTFEWLAEAFADAICSKKPTPLGKATNEYMDNFEKSL